MDQLGCIVLGLGISTLVVWGGKALVLAWMDARAARGPTRPRVRMVHLANGRTQVYADGELIARWPDDYGKALPAVLLDPLVQIEHVASDPLGLNSQRRISEEPLSIDELVALLGAAGTQANRSVVIDREGGYRPQN